MNKKTFKRCVWLVSVISIVSVALYVTEFVVNPRAKIPSAVKPLSRLEQLYESKALVGKSRNEVLDLLGKPNQSDLNAETFYYWIGKEASLIQIDDEWLVVRFRKDRVLSVDRQSD
jgi:hypothetical protein